MYSNKHQSNVTRVTAQAQSASDDSKGKADKLTNYSYDSYELAAVRSLRDVTQQHSYRTNKVHKWDQCPEGAHTRQCQRSPAKANPGRKCE